MDACDKYGKLKMVLEIYEQIEEIKLKPNAAIMNYLLNNLTKNNQSMESVQQLFRKSRERQQEVQVIQSTVQAKVTGELKRRYNSAKKAILNNLPNMIAGATNT